MDGIRVKGESRIEALSDGNLRSCLFGLGGVGETRETRRGSQTARNRAEVMLKACLKDKETSKRVKTAESFQEKHALPNIYCWHWTLYLRGFNAGGGSAVLRILWKKLKGDATKAVRSSVVMGVSIKIEAISVSDADSMWNTLTSIIKDAVKDSLSVAIGTSKTHTTSRKSWWLCEEVQYKVVVKQKRITKARERRRRNLGDIYFLKDEGGRTITNEEEIKKRWGEYLSSLFITREQEGREDIMDPIILKNFGCYYSRISQIEIFASAKMPEEWRHSDIILIFKNKGDAQVYSNYRVIKLLSHTMKLWERVIERRLRIETSKTLIDKGASRRYIKVIRDMYDDAKTWISRGIHEDIQWCLIFTDYIVLVLKSAEGLNNRLKNWREALKDNGLRVSREKTKYLRCDFVYRAELEVETIINKMREGRLRWFGHVRRRPHTAPVSRVKALVVDGLRKIGRPKLRWEGRVKLHIKELLLSDDMTLLCLPCIFGFFCLFGPFAFLAFDRSFSPFSLPYFSMLALVYSEAFSLPVGLLMGRDMFCLHFTSLISCPGGIRFNETGFSTKID
ncbi:hypothetical protein Tco_0184417 [Tanacetum coccineum]